MGTIWIKCPATGRQASTGIETDSASFGQIPQQIETMRCPACGMRHRWLKDDAWLTDADYGVKLGSPDNIRGSTDTRLSRPV
jgi:hypothetical protein